MAAETIPSLLAQRTLGSALIEAIVDQDARLTYAELDKKSRDRATWLVANGVNKNHRVGLLMPNGIEWAINAYAIMRIGAVLVPLSTFLRPTELCAQLADAGVKYLIAVSGYRARNYQQEMATIDRAALPSLHNIWWSTDLGHAGSESECTIAVELEKRVCPADDMVIIFSTGSSGKPKGVIHTHGSAIRANAAGLADRCIRKGTRIYLPMPLFWVGGFAGGLISALNAAATLLTEATIDPKKTLMFLEREKVTLFRGWPDQVARLSRNPNFATTDLSHLVSESLEAILPLALRGDPQRRANLFGMTETFGPFCGYALDKDMPQDKAASCGKPFTGIEVRIVDGDTGEILPPGAGGMIQIRGRNILRGICGREREEIFTADGWYSGGDIGWLDDDDYLYFCGRSDDAIKIKGINVNPREIELALAGIPEVQRAIAVGITLENANSIGIAIVPKSSTTFNLEQLRRYTSEQLSYFKVPSTWIVLNSLHDLPHSVTGKIDKTRLREIMESNKP